VSRGARRAVRWLLRALVAAVVVVLVAAGGLAWRLARGPIALDFLDDRIDRALAQVTGRFRVRVAHTEVAWAGPERGLDLRARDVEVFAPDGAIVARLPAIAIDLAVEPLLHGALVPTSVDVLEPSLRLVRHPDGAVDLGLGAGEERADGGSVLRDVLANLSSDERPAPGTASALRSISIDDGVIEVRDLESGESWRAPSLDVAIRRDGRGLTARLSGELELGPDRMALEGEARVPSAGPASAALTVRGVRPRALAARVAAAPTTAIGRRLAQIGPTLDRIDVDLAGTATVELDATWRPARIAVKLEAGGGTLAIAGDRMPLRRLALVASLDVGQELVRLEEVVVDLGAPTIRATGEVRGLAGDGAVTAQASIAALPIDLAWRAWPPGAASGARAWLTANVSQGKVAHARVRVDAKIADGDLATARAPSVRGDLGYEGLEVRFLETMAPVTKVRGRGTFTQAGFDLGVKSGEIAGMAVGPAKVVISGMDRPTPRIAIDASVKGDVRAAITVLDAPPVQLARAMGVDPAKIGGGMDGRLSLAFPLQGDLSLAGLGLRGRADVAGFALPDAVAGWPISDADLRVDVDARAVRVAGKAAIAGVPADVSWTENLESGVKTERTYAVRAAVDSAGRKALGFDLAPFVEGPVAVAVEGSQPRDAPAEIALRADLAQAAIDVPQMAWKKPPGAPGRLDAKLGASGARVTRIDPASLDAGGLKASGRAIRDPGGDGWQHVDVGGTLAGGGPGDSPGQMAARFDRAEKGYRFEITSNDSGALFRTLGFYGDADGGRLRFTGTLVAPSEELAFDGHAEITDVVISHAPWLARAATLGSFRGIADAFSTSGSGIRFDTVRVDASRARRVTTLADGSAAGSSLGLLFSGTIDQANDQLDLRGTLVPELYGLNSALGKIPVVGSVLFGDHGPVGVDFSIAGRSSDPQVTVHPLDSITPGILGRLFRGNPRAPKRASD